MDSPVEIRVVSLESKLDLVETVEEGSQLEREPPFTFLGGQRVGRKFAWMESRATG